MPLTTIQVPSIILPQEWEVGTETETVADNAEHTSIDIPVEYLQEKIIHIFATEVVVAGVPGNLWCWVELSPVASSISTSYWSAIGGGGGALTPIAPVIEAGVGVMGTVHTFTISWTVHSAYARLVVQTPAPVATAYWAVQAIFSAKTP